MSERTFDIVCATMQVATLVKADWLFLLTDVDHLYTDNPNTNPNAKPILEVPDMGTLQVAYPPSLSHHLLLQSVRFTAAAHLDSVKHPSNVSQITLCPLCPSARRPSMKQCSCVNSSHTPASQLINSCGGWLLDE